MKYLREKNKGFTLIEIIVVMAIVSIISTIVFLEIKSYRSLKNHIDAEYFNNEIVDFINYGRHDCIINECDGHIIFQRNNNMVEFYENSELKDKIDIPVGFSITSNDVTTGDNLIYINNTGVVTTPCSLMYTDRNENLHIVTIGVGTANVEIK